MWFCLPSAEPLTFRFSSPRASIQREAEVSKESARVSPLARRNRPPGCGGIECNLAAPSGAFRTRRRHLSRDRPTQLRHRGHGGRLRPARENTDRRRKARRRQGNSKRIPAVDERALQRSRRGDHGTTRRGIHVPGPLRPRPIARVLHARTNSSGKRKPGQFDGIGKTPDVPAVAAVQSRRTRHALLVGRLASAGCAKEESWWSQTKRQPRRSRSG
jgi:hypothetical protein